MKKAFEKIHTETFLNRRVAHNGDDFIRSYCDAVAQSLGADFVWVSFLNSGALPEDGEYCAPSFLTRKNELKHLFKLKSNGTMWCHDVAQLHSNVVVNDVERARLPKTMTQSLLAVGVKSLGVFLIKSNKKIIGFTVCAFAGQFHRWRGDEVSELAKFGRDVPKEQSTSKVAENIESTVLGAKLTEYQRLAGHGNIVMLHTDNRFRVVDVFGNSRALVGLPRESLIGDAGVWDQIVDRRDRALLRQRIRQMRAKKGELCEELRIVHAETGSVRWLHLRALPQFSSDSEFLGWEGFGVDVTERREAQLAAIEKSRRLEALIDLSHILVGNRDSTTLLLTGLKKLLSAVDADGGYACILNASSDELEIVAARGFSEEFVSRLQVVCKGESLLRQAITDRQALLVEDIQNDRRADKGIARLEDLRSIIVSPMIIGGEVLGALVACKRGAVFKQDDFDMFLAGSMQVGIGLKQLELVDQHRRQRQSVETLLEVTKNLSKALPITEMMQVIFPILTQELAIKSAWMGLVEEQGVGVLGRSAVGRFFTTRESIEIRLRLNGEIPPLSRAIAEQRPVIWRRSGPEQLHSVIIPEARCLIFVPMISLGKVVGVMILEPSSIAPLRSKERIRLLVNIANELATAILVGRYEVRIAEAYKMRMAALLSAGVAHNFNNLLQVILGQTAVIDINCHEDSILKEANKTIAEAAQKGATLVGQLANIASQTPIRKTQYNAQELIKAVVRDSLVAKSDDVACSFHSTVSSSTLLLAHAQQLQHVVNNLFENAQEAFSLSQSDKRIQISAQEVDIKVGQLGAELEPGGYVRIDIADNGSGMTHEQRSRCFEPFYTTKTVDPNSGVGLTGAGLGLATSYQIVKAHGGIMTIRSGAGAGTISSIYIPFAAKDESEASEQESLTENTFQSQEVILLNLHPSVYGSVLSAVESLQIPSRGTFDVSQVLEILSGPSKRFYRVIIDADVYGDRTDGVVDTVLAANPRTHVLIIGESVKVEAYPEKRIFIRTKPVSMWSLKDFLRLDNSHRN
jgi:PAS domain S-box-containing protein